jgi:hypothetical protein
MEAYLGVEVYFHVSLTSALYGGVWSASRPGFFTPRERAPCTHWTGGWVGPRTGLDAVMRKIRSPSDGEKQKKKEVTMYENVS